MTQKRQDRLEGKIDILIDHVGDIKTRVAVIEESQKNSEKDREATQKSVELLASRVDKNADRIGGLERFQVKITALAGVAGSALALGGDWLKHKIFGS